MTTLKIKQAGSWVPIAGEVNASNPVNDYITANTPTPWANLTLENSWTVTPGYVAQYRRLSPYLGQLIGRITAGNNGIHAFTLPVGYRPMMAAGSYE
jgi:hypothetical protein